MMTQTRTLGAAVYERLRDSGPATAKELASVCGGCRRSVANILSHDPRLGIVGTKPGGRNQKAILWGVRASPAPEGWSAVFRIVAVEVWPDGDAELSLAPWRDAGTPVATITVAALDWPGSRWPPVAGMRVRVIPARVELVDAEWERRT